MRLGLHQTNLVASASHQFDKPDLSIIFLECPAGADALVNKGAPNKENNMTDGYFAAEMDLPTPRPLTRSHPHCPRTISATTATAFEGASHSAPWGYASVGICKLHFHVLVAQFISFVTSVALKTVPGATSTAPWGYNAKSSVRAAQLRNPKDRNPKEVRKSKTKSGGGGGANSSVFGFLSVFGVRTSNFPTPFIIDASRRAFRIAPTLL